MKMTKKKVLVLALAISLIALISMGTLAWFHDADSVVNEFFVADSTDTTPDDIFDVNVWERIDEDGDGQIDATITAETGFDYKDVLPGDKLVKEPFVRNEGYYDQYVRVIVTISDATAWINAMGLDFEIEDVFEGYDATQWNHVEKIIEGSTDTITYVLYYNGILDGDDTANDSTSGTNDSVVLFTHVNIPESLTREQAAQFRSMFSISIKAQAVQTENVVPAGTVAEDAAFKAFETVGLPL